MNEDGLIKRAIDKESFLGIDKFSSDRYFTKLNSDSEIDLVKRADAPSRRILDVMFCAILRYMEEESDDDDFD